MKISIIVPVYNMEQYLEHCLDSLISQTMMDKEIICVNDGSSDKSSYILNTYAERYKDIKVINQKNSGVGRARNNGINIAQGEYIAFVDPDDWYPDTDILDSLYDRAKIENVLICGGSFSSYYNGNIKTEYDSGYTFREDRRVRFKDYQWDYGFHRFIYNLSMLRTNSIYFPEYRRYQDPPFFVNAMLQAEEFYGIKKITYRYRLGHKEIEWTIEKTQDLLRGLIDNLLISEKYGLSRLHYNTVYRINNDFFQPISNNLLNYNKEVLELVLKVSKCINPQLLRKEAPNIAEPYLLLNI